MAKTLDQLPLLPQALSGTDIILIKTVVDGTPLDFKVDINTFLQDYVNISEIGTDINDIIRLVDDGAGNAGLPPVSGALLTNIAQATATETILGSVRLSDSLTSNSGVNGGVAATSKAVRDAVNSSVQKAGDTLTGNLTFPNNTGLTFTKQGGSTFVGIRINTADNLELGGLTNTYNRAHIYVEDLVTIRDETGSTIFTFNVDGSVTGIDSSSIGFTPYTYLSATNTQTAIQQLADQALRRSGGQMTGNLSLDNTVGITGRNNANTNFIPLLNTTSTDDLLVGDTGSNAPNEIRNTIKTNFIIRDETGTALFTFSHDGTVSGLDSEYVDFAGGGFTSTNVKDALIELETKALSAGGGEITGDILLQNDVGIVGLNNSGQPVDLLKLTPSDNLELGNSTNKFNNFDVTMSGDSIIRNSSGTVLFRFNQDGSSSGIEASDITSTASGNISATTVQGALQELDSDKLNRVNGLVSGSLDFLNNTPLRMRNSGGSSLDIIRVSTTNNLLFGDSSTRFNDFMIVTGKLDH